MSHAVRRGEYDSSIGSCGFDQLLQMTLPHEWHVGAEDQDKLVRCAAQGYPKTFQRSQIRPLVHDENAGVLQIRKRIAANDAWCETEGTQCINCMNEQRFSLPDRERLVAAESRRPSAGKDK